MAHRSQLAYVGMLAESLAEHFRNRRVLEIGSLDINGTTRTFFKDCDYTGLDISAGPGVDVVCEGQKYQAPDNDFDVVISCNVMEHNPHWADTMRNMIRLCRPGGLVIMTCTSTGFPEHGTARTTPGASPFTVKNGWNYYKNLTERDFRGVIDFAAAFSMHRFWVNWSGYDLAFVGMKCGSTIAPAELKSWDENMRLIDQWIDQENAPRAHRYRAAMARLFGDRWFVAMHRLSANMIWFHQPH